MKINSFTLCILMVFLLALNIAASPRLDSWADIWLSLGAAENAGDNICASLASGAFKLDYVNKQNGSFSIAYDSSSAPTIKAIGFVAGEYIPYWSIYEGFKLVMTIKIESAQTPNRLEAVLFDSNNNQLLISARLKKNDTWQRLVFDINGDKDFNFSKVARCEFSQPFLRDAKILFDDVYFFNPKTGSQVGITKKTVEQRISDSESKRAARSNHALANYNTIGLREAFKEILFKLIAGKDIDWVNNQLLDILTTADEDVRERYRLNDHWCLTTNQMLYRIYYMFGSKGTVQAGRISSDVEKALLSELWDRTYKKNDMHLTNQSTWWMIGSENHDVISKVSSLIASQIFKNEPDYAQRLYPDYGSGGADGYWFHSRIADDEGNIGPHGREMKGPLYRYNSEDHYQAWVKYWKEYLVERIKRGFFLEAASAGYMSVTISHIMDIADLCKDEQLRALAKDFLDLVWYEWAQDSICGVRGGAKTRSIDGFHYKDSMYWFATFEFGGLLGNTSGNYWIPLVTEYRIPEGVWRMSLDRESLGKFAYISRKPGEEENVWARPFGQERTLLCDTQSRFVRYSWVTPDYILGCQMDHPAAVHSHLSVAMRWQGIIFSGDKGARVFPMRVLFNEELDDWVASRGAYMRNVQHENVMITQQSRRWLQQNPDWFPCVDMSGLDMGVYFGDSLEKRIEKGGWIFVAQTNSYLAVRIIQPPKQQRFRVGIDQTGTSLTYEAAQDSYQWNKAGTIALLKDKHSPIIFEAASREDYESIEQFADEIISNKLELGKIVVPGWFTLTYKGAGDNAAEIYFNAANNEIPRINGEPINYEPKKTFDSPFISSYYGEPIVKIYNCNETEYIDASK